LFQGKFMSLESFLPLRWEENCFTGNEKGEKKRRYQKEGNGGTFACSKRRKGLILTHKRPTSATAEIRGGEEGKGEPNSNDGEKGRRIEHQSPYPKGGLLTPINKINSFCWEKRKLN